jgi:hypothetical protein
MTIAGIFLPGAEEDRVYQIKGQIICARSRRYVRLFHFSHALLACIQFALHCIGSYDARALGSGRLILLTELSHTKSSDFGTFVIVQPIGIAIAQRKT